MALQGTGVCTFGTAHSCPAAIVEQPGVLGSFFTAPVWLWVEWVGIENSFYENTALDLSLSTLHSKGEPCLCLGRSQTKQKISTENGGNTPTEVLIAT